MSNAPTTSRDTRKKITREQGFSLFDFLQHEEVEGRTKLVVYPDQIHFESDNASSGFLTRIDGVGGKVDHWRLTGMIGGQKVSFEQFTWMFPAEVFTA